MRTIFLMFVALMLLAPATVSACPLCKEAIGASQGPEDEPNNEPAAYNQSIYLMVSVPYLLLGTVGFLIVRGVRKNQAFFEEQRRIAAQNSPQE